MQTANFITASAEVTTITKLKKGDVYKRLEDSTYSGDEIIHGIVLDVLYNGTDAAIQTMEFKGSYNSLDTTFKVFGGSKEIKIFPSSQEEVQTYLKDSVESIKRDITTKEKALAEAHDKLEQAKNIVSGELIKSLTIPEYSDKPLAAIAATDTTDGSVDLDSIGF